MGVFHSERKFQTDCQNLELVAKDVESHFQAKGFEVQRQSTITGGWNVGVSKGNLFKAVLGMRTALNIEIERTGAFVAVKAGVGVLGQQAVPTAITWFIAWPVAFAQIWGLIQQSKLDEEAIEVAARSLAAHSSGAAGPAPAGAEGAPDGEFCTACGKPLTPAAKFCPECGAKQAA